MDHSRDIDRKICQSAIWVPKHVYRGSATDLSNQKYGSLTGSERVIAGTEIDKFGLVRSACVKGLSVTMFGPV